MSIHSRFILSLHRIYHYLLPPSCVLCGYLTHTPYNICHPCQHDLPILPNHCPQCARFVSIAKPCGECLTSPPAFDRTFTLFPYEFPIIQLIIQLKFQHQFSHAKALGELLTQAIQTNWYANQRLPDVIIPIPLHAKRLRERGFNQALEIAKPIAKTLAIPIDKTGVKRIKPTLAQSTLPAAERKQNMANAFILTRDYSGLSVAVVDDVITTGSTIRECCRMLKQAGAKHIDVWCCARRG